MPFPIPLRTPSPAGLILIAFAILAAALGPSVAQTAPTAPAPARVGRPAPAFTLTDSKGRTHTLADLKGRTVVLEWTDPDCPYVARTVRSGRMRRAFDTIRAIDKTAVWLAVNSTHGTTAAANNEWIDRHKLPYPILLDAEGAVGRRYAVRTTLHMFVIDKEGVLRYHGAIDDDRSGAKPESKVRNFVVHAVRQLADGKVVVPDFERPYGCAIKYRPPATRR